MSDGALDRLCEALGIQRRYRDQVGGSHEAPPAVLQAMLEALGHPAGDDAEAALALGSLRRFSVARTVPATLALRQDDENPEAPVTLPSNGPQELSWRVTEESGEQHSGTARFGELPLRESLTVDDATWERRGLPLPHLPLGYHRLELRIAGQPEPLAARLIVVPARTYMPADLETGNGIWGLAVQLYSLRSARNWGIGDFTDLKQLVERAAATGASFVGLNPLHALYPDAPESASPYSPSSRLFLNSLYIDPESVEEFATVEPNLLELFFATRRRLQDAALIDYRAVGDCKQALFELLFESFAAKHLARDSARAASFRDFQRGRGSALRRFATFQALRERLGREDGRLRDWRTWPAEYRDPDAGAVADFAAGERRRIEFFEYLQWQASLQLEEASKAARAAGMAIGLYVDLAVGVDAGGADAWAFQDTLVQGWSLGAPPDEWNLKGQSWGLPPFEPRRLADFGYAPLIETLRASMRGAGALRIDHVLGLRRLFWVREGTGPADGLYLHYPFEALAGIVALESQRNRCLIVGEDLGTLPEGLQEALQAVGLLSYRLLYFTRRDDGRFQPPEHYPRQATVAVSTHDLPPLAAWWSGRDIELRAALDLYPSRERLERDIRERPGARRFLAMALREAGLSADENSEEPPFEAVHRFLARSHARIVVLQAEDMLALEDPVNVPGTTTEHPNWRRRLPVETGRIFDRPLAQRLRSALAEERPNSGKRES